MSPEELRTSVAEDSYLRLVPDGDAQHELGVLLNGRRRKNLAGAMTQIETITHSTVYLKRVYPSWRPNIDSAYFDLR